MRRRALAIALGAAAVVALAGCSSTPTKSVEWSASSACASPSTVGATAQLADAQFTVKGSSTEAPANGCSYLASGGHTQLNVDVVPGAPSSVQFGSAVKLTTKQLPKLGTGAESVTSPTFCTLIVPAAGGNTMQIELIGAKSDLEAPCGHLTDLLTEFATKKTVASS